MHLIISSILAWATKDFWRSFFYAKEYRLLDRPPAVMSRSRRFIP